MNQTRTRSERGRERAYRLSLFLDDDRRRQFERNLGFLKGRGAADDTDAITTAVRMVCEALGSFREPRR